MSLGERVADDLRAGISRTIGLGVASRRSETTDVPFVVAGSVITEGEMAEVFLELSETRNDVMVWQDRFRVELADLTASDAPAMTAVAAEISLRIMQFELDRAKGQPFDTLESHTLLIAAISMMNRLAHPGFDNARDAFEALIETAGRHPTPLSWLAIWYVFRRLQGWTVDVGVEDRVVRDLMRRALNSAPDDALVLTAAGLVAAHIDGDGAAADAHFVAALVAAPSDPLAFAARAITLASLGEGEAAVEAAMKASAISPLDPQLFVFQTAAAMALLAAGDAEAARDVAAAARMNNEHFVVAWVMHGLASARAGDEAGARASLAEAMARDAGLTADGFWARFPVAERDVLVEEMQALGVPAGDRGSPDT